MKPHLAYVFPSWKGAVVQFHSHFRQYSFRHSISSLLQSLATIASPLGNKGNRDTRGSVSRSRNWMKRSTVFFQCKACLFLGAYLSTSCFKWGRIPLNEGDQDSFVTRYPRTTSLSAVSAVPQCQNQMNLWKDQRRPEMATPKLPEKTRSVAPKDRHIMAYQSPANTIGPFGSSPSSSKSSSTEDLRLEDQASQRPAWKALAG